MLRLVVGRQSAASWMASLALPLVPFWAITATVYIGSRTLPSLSRTRPFGDRRGTCHRPIPPRAWPTLWSVREPAERPTAYSCHLAPETVTATDDSDGEGGETIAVAASQSGTSDSAVTATANDKPPLTGQFVGRAAALNARLCSSLNCGWRRDHSQQHNTSYNGVRVDAKVCEDGTTGQAGNSPGMERQELTGFGCGRGSAPCGDDASRGSRRRMHGGRKSSAEAIRGDHPRAKLGGL